MKLALHITKNYNMKDYSKSSHIRIAVIDKDISKKYPDNFVCILPRTLAKTSKNLNQFQKKYGDKSKQIIEQLLNKALKSEEDLAIKRELQERLRILNPKPKNFVKCKNCGTDFQAKRYGYRFQNICYECKAKKYLNKDQELWSD